MTAVMSNGHNNLLEFGNCRLDADRKLLWADGHLVQLPPKAIELLCVLVNGRGEVITKDEIWREVWDDSFVEESNLTHNIYILRKALKGVGHLKVIETVPRRGYRFCGEVHEIANGDIILEHYTVERTTIEFQGEDDTRSFPAAGKETEVRLTVWTRPRRAMLWALAACVVLAAGFFFVRHVPVYTKTSPSDIRSIAVLPVRSFSESADDEELRMRITDALITCLGELDGTAVRPTSAVLPFATSGENAIDIGKQLRVDAVIESRLQQEGDKLRVTVQLIRVPTGEQIWSDQVDGKANEILNLQDHISYEVARQLSPNAVPQPAIPKRPTESSDAYESYLNGRYFWSKRDEASLRKAIEYFKQAAEIDPKFSEAYTGIADTEHLLFNYNIDLNPELIADAKTNLHRALELKPNSADALTTLGTIQMGYDWDWKAAEVSLKAATAAAPNSATARMRYGALLLRLARFNEAQAEFEKAIELDPLSIVGNANLGTVFFCEKEFSAADEQYKRTLAINDKVGGVHWMLSRSLWLEGRRDDSVKEIELGLELDGNQALADKLNAVAKTGTPDDVIRQLLFAWRNNPPGTNPHNLAYLSIMIGERKKAMYWVERSVAEHHPWTTWFYAAPEFETLRDLQRFREILRQLKFTKS